MEIRLHDLQAGYCDLVTMIRETGHRVAVRDLMTRELTGVTLRFDNTAQPLLPVDIGRQVNTKLAAVEALQLIGGIHVQELIDRATPDFGRVLVDPDNQSYGAYGPRVAAQLPDIIQLLRTSPSTRQAVMEVWHTEDLMHRGDKPCTLTLQFLIRYNRLELHVNMRSQDVWLGVPYDVFMFSQLQLTIARLLGIVSGAYVHHVASLHLYADDVDRSHQLHRPTKTAKLPLGIAPVSRTEMDDVMTDVRLLLRNELTSILDNEWPLRNAWYVGRIVELHESQEVAP